jgi:formate C-acetyltransferase
MQITVVDTATLLDARDHPERYPNLMVRVAGYSARFIDLIPLEQDEIIGRSLQQQL